MICALFLCLLSIIPYDPLTRDSVDVIEVNHYFDDQGRLVFDQLIMYDWNYKETNRHQVRAWRLIKPESGGMIPIKDWDTKVYRSMWVDGEIIRHVTSRGIRETFTQYDPELIEREFLPKEKRRELRPKKVKNEQHTNNERNESTRQEPAP